MSQESFSDTLNRLVPFFIKIFEWSKNRSFSSMGVGAIGSKMTKF